jgi:hypothetical protein
MRVVIPGDYHPRHEDAESAVWHVMPQYRKSGVACAHGTKEREALGACICVTENGTTSHDSRERSVPDEQYVLFRSRDEIFECFGRARILIVEVLFIRIPIPWYGHVLEYGRIDALEFFGIFGHPLLFTRAPTLDKQF